jgi:hypothetical protein
MDLDPVACIDMYCLGRCSKVCVRVDNRSRQIWDPSQKSHSLNKLLRYGLVQDVWVRTAPQIWYSIVVHLFDMQKYMEISAWIFNKKNRTKCISKQFKFISFQCSVRFEIQSAGKLFSTMHMLQAVSHNHLLSWKWMSREWSLTTFPAVQSQTTALRERLLVQTHFKEAREVSRCGIRGTVCDNERQTYPCA